MNQVYVFEDWTSASRMRNEVDPNLKVDVGVIRRPQGKGIDGYQITVYDSRIGRDLYKFYVDVGLPHTWSLSTKEAIELLNYVGFPCKYEGTSKVISYDCEKILESLLQLGYTHIFRKSRPAEVFVAQEGRLPIPLSKITTYHYHDFWTVDDKPCRIKGILGKED